MIPMVNMTTRRTDKDVLRIIQEALKQDETISIEAIAHKLDCERKTVIRSISRLENLQRVVVNRKQRPNRYEIRE